MEHLTVAQLQDKLGLADLVIEKLFQDEYKDDPRTPALQARWEADRQAIIAELQRRVPPGTPQVVGVKTLALTGQVGR